jgi:hypothetical protein
MISTVSLSFDLTYTNPVTGALQPRGIVTDSTDYTGLGINLLIGQAKGYGVITFNGDVIEQHDTVLDPLIDLQNWDYAEDGTPTYIFNLPLDLNGNVVNGVYTFTYSLRLVANPFLGLPVNGDVAAPDTLTVTSNEWISQFLEDGDVIQLFGVPGTSTHTILTGEYVDPDSVFTITAPPEDGTYSFLFDITNTQLSGVYTYSGCTQTTANVSFTYDCEYGDNGIWSVSNTTSLASNEVITTLNCSINYPSWATLSPTFPGNVVVTSLPYPSAPNTPTPLATGTYTVSLTQQIQQTQTDGLILQYSTSVIKEFAVSCAGSLCGLTPCIENLRVAHANELQRNRISKYQVFVDNVLLYYAEAQNYRACGDTANYRSTLELIKHNLDSSGCECACCDDNTYYWVSNNSGVSVIDGLIQAFQFRLFDGIPSITEDVTQGVQIGALWEDFNTGILYRCTDNTEGAAVWEEYYAPGQTPDAIDIPAEFVGHNYLTANNVQLQLDQVDALAIFGGTNGLNKDGNDLRLGGPLDEPTTINCAAGVLTLTGSGLTLNIETLDGPASQMTVEQASTNTVPGNLLIGTTTTGGAGANGIGSSIWFRAQDAVGSVSTTSRIISTWSNATTGNSNFEITTKEGNVENTVFRLGFNGLVAFDAYGVGDFNLSTPEYSLAVDANGSVIEVPFVFTYAGRTRFSAGAIQISEYGNTTGATISISNSGVGIYTITASSAIFTTNTVAFVQLQGAPGFTTSVVTNNTTITINTYSAAGVLDDAVIASGSFIKIEIYS